MGMSIQIYRDLCKGCRLCCDICNHGVLDMSKERGKQGYMVPKVIDDTNCKGCLLCETICPDMAIEIKSKE